MRARVALDTNMLVAIYSLGVDVFSGVRGLVGNAEFLIPEQVVAELEGLAQGSKKLEKAMNIALEAAEKAGAKLIGARAGNADEALIKLIDDNTIVATNDRNLRKRVRGLGGRAIFIRKRKFLEME